MRQYKIVNEVYLHNAKLRAGVIDKDISNELGMDSKDYTNVKRGKIRLTKEEMIKLCKLLQINGAKLLVAPEEGEAIREFAPEKAVKIMKNSRVTTTEIGNRMGIAPCLAEKYVTGKLIPKNITLYKLAEALRVRVWDIVG